MSIQKYWCSSCNKFVEFDVAHIPVHWIEDEKDMHDISNRIFCVHCQGYIVEGITDGN